MFTQIDLNLFASKGISVAQIEEQLSCFVSGFPYLPLAASASVERGIWR